MSELAGADSYDPTKLWGDMRLTEAEIYFAVSAVGYVGMFLEGEYGMLKAGERVTIVTDGTERYREPQTFGICIDRIVDAETPIDEAPGNPPSKIWEGTITHSTLSSRTTGDEAFCMFGPSGFTLLVDSGPETEETDLRIKFGILLRSRGRI